MVENLSSKFEGKDLSFMFPFARSSRNSAGFIDISGEQPMVEKYFIASDALPKYKELPFPRSISLSNLQNSLLDGW